jgi:hypothetical protein
MKANNAISKAEWNRTKPMWVIGTISSEGVVGNIKISSGNSNPTHLPNLHGHRWRWCVWGQDWHSTLGCNDISPEETEIVSAWLDKNGYVYHKPVKELRRKILGMQFIADRKPGFKTWWHSEDDKYWVIRTIGLEPWELYEGNPYGSGVLIDCASTLKSLERKKPLGEI